MLKDEIKTPEETVLMAEGGGKLAQIISRVIGKIKPGLSTLEIDSWIDEGIAASGGRPSFKFVPRYHWASCVGVNSEVVHSIPAKDKIIKEGDALKIDAGMRWKGFNTDAAWTIRVQKTEDGRQKDSFLEAGKEALRRAIAAAKPGNRVGHVSLAIEETIRGAGFWPVTLLTGHGVGRQLHEEPMIPCVLKDKLGKTPFLAPGMTLAIEVIYTLEQTELQVEKDNWTISTKDGKISGLFEETIAVCENGPLVLTEVRE